MVSPIRLSPFLHINSNMMIFTYQLSTLIVTKVSRLVFLF